MEEVKEFYSTAEAYLTKWIATLSILNVFSWMLLTDVLSWTSIEESCQYLNEKGIDVNDSLLHNQFNNIMTDNRAEWKEKQCENKWIDFFSKCDCEDQYSEVLKICRYVFSIPAHNANTERVFSQMNIQWSDERNRMEVSTIEAILQ
jgi:hypothetical protein